MLLSANEHASLLAFPMSFTGQPTATPTGIAGVTGAKLPPSRRSIARSLSVGSYGDKRKKALCAVLRCGTRAEKLVLLSGRPEWVCVEHYEKVKS